MKTLLFFAIGVAIVCVGALINDGSNDLAPAKKSVRDVEAQPKSTDSLQGSGRTGRERSPPIDSNPTMFELKTLKWRNAQESAILGGLAPSQPAFHSIVDLSSIGGGGIIGSAATIKVRDYRSNEDGERQVEYNISSQVL